MTKLRIPDEQRPAVVALSQMPAPALDALLADLKGATPSLKGVREAVGKHFKTDVGAIAATLVSLAMITTTQADVTAAEVNANIHETLEDEGGEADLSKLIASPTVVALAKTIDLRTAHERILQDFRIFTDIRPVFERDVEEALESAIVTHTARITFGTSSGVEELFVALAHSDLNDIKKVVERALVKEQRAYDFIQTRDGRVLNSFEEDE